jgi:hypothetical protein
LDIVDDLRDIAENLRKLNGEADWKKVLLKLLHRLTKEEVKKETNKTF